MVLNLDNGSKVGGCHRFIPSPSSQQREKFSASRNNVPDPSATLQSACLWSSADPCTRRAHPLWPQAGGAGLCNLGVVEGCRTCNDRFRHADLRC